MSVEPLDPPYPGPPRWRHQVQVFERSKDAEYHALLLEQRCGKTAILVDTVTHLFREGRIDALAYVGPNGVHRDFAREHLPLWLGRDIPYAVHAWSAAKWSQRNQELERRVLLKFPGLSVVCVNTEALITKGVRKYLHEFLTARRALLAVDESIDISSHRAARTKVAIRCALMAPYRRILDGTPADASPFGLFTQTEFLKPGALGFAPTRVVRGKLSFPGRIAFENRYAEMEMSWAGGVEHRAIALDEHGRKVYRNLDELSRRLAKFSSRVTRDQCADMPPKVYERRPFQLTGEQRRVYERLRDDFIAELRSGDTVTADMVMVRYLRLQQVASNHMPVRDTDPCPACQGDGCDSCDGLGFTLARARVVRIADEDARLAAFERGVAQLRPDDGVIVWARFRPDVDLLCAWAASSGQSFARYDGAADAEARASARRDFQQGRVRFVFGNPVAGGRGTDFSRASAVVYYSHTWSLRWRRQSEDRAQNLMKREPTLYLDLVAEDTVDERIMAALKENKSLAELVMARGVDWALS